MAESDGTSLPNRKLASVGLFNLLRPEGSTILYGANVQVCSLSTLSLINVHYPLGSRGGHIWLLNYCAYCAVCQWTSCEIASSYGTSKKFSVLSKKYTKSIRAEKLQLCNKVTEWIQPFLVQWKPAEDLMQKKIRLLCETGRKLCRLWNAIIESWNVLPLFKWGTDLLRKID